MLLLDIFSGAGGLSKGLSMSEAFQPIANIECDHAAARTYENNFPQAHVFKERIENVTPESVLDVIRKKGHSKIDAICGGPPCRPFSKANRGSTQWKIVKETQNIARHPDWINYLRFVRELKPSFVIAENVMGFRRNTEVFAPFVNALKRMGYSVSPTLLNVSKFGVPQTRERIIIIAAKGKFSSSDLVPIQQDRKVPTVHDAIIDLPKLNNEKHGKEISSYTMRPSSNYASLLRSRQDILYNHVVHSVHPVVQKRFQYIPQGYNLKKAWNEGKIPKDILCAGYELRGRIRKYTPEAMNNIHGNIYRRIKWKSPSPTITHPRKTVLIHPSQNRLLSVRECARIQGFPDSFRFFGSINQQYQQVADAVPPLLSMEIGIKLNSLVRENTPLIIAR